MTELSFRGYQTGWSSGPQEPHMIKGKMESTSPEKEEPSAMVQAGSAWGAALLKIV